MAHTKGIVMHKLVHQIAVDATSLALVYGTHTTLHGLRSEWVVCGPIVFLLPFLHADLGSSGSICLLSVEWSADRQDWSEEDLAPNRNSQCSRMDPDCNLPLRHICGSKCIQSDNPDWEVPDWCGQQWYLCKHSSKLR